MFTYFKKLKMKREIHIKDKQRKREMETNHQLTSEVENGMQSIESKLRQEKVEKFKEIMREVMENKRKIKVMNKELETKKEEINAYTVRGIQTDVEGLQNKLVNIEKQIETFRSMNVQLKQTRKVVHDTIYVIDKEIKKAHVN